MLLAIEKYGLIKGIIKGLKRIWKCKYPNGGLDYP
jgi:putative component of membrane protein insertase Oxa1/YidC/SpoIIIJ protein YidD